MILLPKTHLCSRLFGILAALLPATNYAIAQERLGPGDVVEVSVAGVPELKHRAPIEPDGSFSIPLLGTLSIGGLTAAEARAKIQVTMARQTYRQKTQDGRERQLVISPNEVSATVVEYRPIYVGGDVAKPGEYPFRPYTTVRQVLASAGGFDIPRPQNTRSAYFEDLELRSDQASVANELIREKIHVLRLRAELKGEAAVNMEFGAETQVSKGDLQDLLALENDLLKARIESRRGERLHLERSIARASEEINVLTEQQKKEEEGTQSDDEEFQRVSELFKKGAVAITRVTDARRAALLSSTRRLQTSAELLQVTRQKSEAERELERLDLDRDTKVIQELQIANGKVSSLKAKLQYLDNKLQLYSGRDILGSARAGIVTVYRNNAGGIDKFIADGTTMLQPGDALEVNLRAEHSQ